MRAMVESLRRLFQKGSVDRGFIERLADSQKITLAETAYILEKE